VRSKSETPGGADALRAVAVPFDAAPLLGARVRPDPDCGKAALVHDFGGSGATYVIPWADLPACVRLAPFDAALHSEVAALQACTPAAIRGALAVVSRPELATPERFAAMRRRLGIEEDARVELALTVLGRLLRPLPARLEDLDALVYGAARERGVAALRQACARHGISADRFADVHGELVSELILVGLPGRAGWLRLVHQELSQLHRTLQRRLHAEADAADPLRRIMGAASGTIAGAAQPLASLDAQTRDLWRVFAHWEEVRPLLRGMVTDLDWRLDGWPKILQAVADAAWSPCEDRRATFARAALIAEGLGRE
jgi:hypothetical protein